MISACPAVPVPTFCERNKRARVSISTNEPTLADGDAGARDDGDDVLVQRIAAGDQRAFNDVVRRHAGRLRSLALGFTGGAAEADDIVQETFWSFWRNAGKWKTGGPPLGAYLTRIAINRAIDRSRRRRVRQFFGLEDAADIAAPDAPQDEQMATEGELTAVLGDIKALPPRQRAAILLAAEGERSNAEIAQILGQTVGAVEQLLVRARRKLRSNLAERLD